MSFPKRKCSHKIKYTADSPWNDFVLLKSKPKKKLFNEVVSTHSLNHIPQPPSALKPKSTFRYPSNKG